MLRASVPLPAQHLLNNVRIVCQRLSYFLFAPGASVCRIKIGDPEGFEPITSLLPSGREQTTFLPLSHQLIYYCSLNNTD